MLYYTTILCSYTWRSSTQYTPFCGEVPQSVDNASLICLQFFPLSSFVCPTDGTILCVYHPQIIIYQVFQLASYMPVTCVVSTLNFHITKQLKDQVECNHCLLHYCYHMFLLEMWIAIHAHS